EEAVEIITQAWTQTEPFSYEGRFFTIRDTRVMPKPFQKPHPPLYQVCGSKESIEGTAARGWPMLNSVLRGNAEQQLATNREAYVAAARKAGQSEDDITGLLRNWGVSRQIYVAPTDAQALAESKDAELWYQESFRRFVIPERIEEAHPSLQPHFRQLAERLARVNWDDLVRETVAFGSPETTEKLAWGEPTWRVRGKLFAQLDDHHHGANHLAVWLPAPLGEQEAMIFTDPVRFFRPPYAGHRGWVGVRIDRRPDWTLVAK